jgi:hypothetical protein
MFTTTQEIDARRAALGLVFTAALAALPAGAAVTFNGWNAGTSASSFGWSSDLFGSNSLGLPDIACVYAGASATCADPRYPHGTTTPGNLAAFTPIAGQQVKTMIQRPILTGNVDMRASMTADVQRLGDIEGQVTHIRFENAVPSFSPFIYGLFTNDTVGGSFLFGGVGAATTLYYYYEWDLDADATGAGFGVGYGVGLDGTQAGATNLGAQGLARSGSRGGSVVGRSTLDPRLSLDLFSPSLATAARTHGTASLDFWITFSTQPINGLPNPGGGSVPEPPAWTLALAALGLLWRSRQQAR